MTKATVNIETIEGNKLIAEFMGYEGQHEEWCGNNILDKDEFLHNGEMRPYRPNEWWNDLMPVVEKIGKIEGYSIQITFSQEPSCRIWSNKELAPKPYWKVNAGKIEATWLACVQFITWYNQSK